MFDVGVGVQRNMHVKMNSFYNQRENRRSWGYKRLGRAGLGLAHELAGR